MKSFIAFVVMAGVMLQLGEAGSLYKKHHCKYPGHFKDPYDCTAFIQCDAHGLAHYLYCPYGTVFSPKHKVCVHPTKYSCTNSYSHGVYGYKKNPCKKRYRTNGLLPYKKNCHYYIQCSNGRPYLMPCPAGLVWNNHAKMCDWYQPKYYDYSYCHYHKY